MDSLRYWVGLAVALVLISGCGSGSAGDQRKADQPAPSLVGTRWLWVGSTIGSVDAEVAEPHRYTLLLHSDGGAEFRFDCNRGRGDYQLDGDRLRFGPIMTTRMACPEDSRDFEFGQQLDGVASFSLDGDVVQLRLRSEGDVMRFRAETQ
jgi:heat shock protein HslJ